MDKQILEQYIDACELIKDTKEEIRKLRKRRSQIQQDSVKGSSHEFPYTLQTYHLEGLGYAAVKDPDELERMEVLLEERIRNAEKIKRQVEAWLNTVSPRMQRIIRYRVFEDMTWAGGYEDGEKGHRSKCKNGISKIYVCGIKFVTNVTNVTNQNVIVYHEAKGIQPTAYT